MGRRGEKKAHYLSTFTLAKKKESESLSLSDPSTFFPFPLSNNFRTDLTLSGSRSSYGTGSLAETQSSSPGSRPVMEFRVPPIILLMVNMMRWEMLWRLWD
jgi:hypothetical protein